MYGNTQIAILLFLPMLWICENLDCKTQKFSHCMESDSDLSHVPSSGVGLVRICECK